MTNQDMTNDVPPVSEDELREINEAQLRRERQDAMLEAGDFPTLMALAIASND